MPDGQLHADVDDYLRAAGMNTPPPPIPADQLVSGATPVEQILRMLSLAANSGDPRDSAESLAEHLRRETATNAAAAAFAAQDIEAEAGLDGLDELNGLVDPDNPAAMAQQLPQLISGIAGAVVGAVSGALQPLTQVPQQLAQGAQQALQAGTSLFGDAVGEAATPIDESLSPLLDDFGSLTDFPDDLDGFDGSGFGGAPGSGGAGSSGAGGGGAPTTLPTTVLGPPPIPSASTAPSSAPAATIGAPKAPTPGAPHGGGFAGMPMIPPGAMGAAANADKDPKADTKRVSVPPVRNGAPIQGRLTPPPSLPQTDRKPTGKPVATRRIITPPSNGGGDAPGGGSGSAS